MDISRLKSRSNIVPGLLILAAILLFMLPNFGSRYSVTQLSDILKYVILTVSWVIFSGPTGYISLASAAFFGLGIYTTAVLGDSNSFLVVILIGAALSFVVALLVGILTLRLRGIYFAIFTFGFVELLRHVVLYAEFKITATRGRFVAGHDNETVYYAMLGLFIVMMIAAYIIRRSKFGLALQSIGENEEASSHVGINVTALKVVTFAISAIFMGATGAIAAAKMPYIDPGIAFHTNYSFMPVLMALIGGMGQLYGPVIGAAIFTYLEEILLTKFSELYMLIFGAVLVVAILYLPNGLVGLIEKLWYKWKVRSGGQRANT
jgi:branched-chain amino acid transport system permease protein